MTEFLTPKQIQEHHIKQAKPLLDKAAARINEMLLIARFENGTCRIRLDLEFEPVLPQITQSLRQKGWKAGWEIVWTKDRTDSPQKSEIAMALSYPDSSVLSQYNSSDVVTNG